MADQKVNQPAPGNNLMFDLEAFSRDVQARDTALQNAAQTQQQALSAEQQQLEQLLGINQRAVVLRQGYQEAVKPVVDENLRLAAAAEEQRRLAAGGFTDQFKAWMNARENPNLYTSQGRAKVMSELQQSLSLTGQMTSAALETLAAEQQVVNAQGALNQIDNRKAAANLAIQQSLVDAHLNKIQTVTAGIRANRDAQDAVIDQMTDEDLIRSMSAIDPNTKKINVGGIDLTQRMIEAEQQRREGLRYNYQIQQMAMERQNEHLRKAANEKLIANLTDAQLNSLMIGKPIDVAPGVDQTQKVAMYPSDFDMSVVARINQNRTEIRAREQKQMTDQAFAGTIVNDVILPMYQQSDIVAKNSTIGEESPVKATAKLRVQQLANVKTRLDEMAANLDTTSPIAVAEYAKQQEVVRAELQKLQTADNAMIDKEAKIRAHGNKYLATLYTSHYKASTVDPAVAREGAVDELVSGRMPAEFIGTQLGVEAKKRFDDKVNAARVSGAEGLFKGNTLDKSVAAQYAYEALDETINNSLGKHTDWSLANLTSTVLNGDIEPNPVSQAFDANGRKIFPTGEAFLDTVRESDSAALNQVFTDPKYAKLADDQKRMLVDGKNVQLDDKTVISAADFLYQLRLEEGVQLYLSLEQKRPGLGQQYGDWWDRFGEQYAQQYTGEAVKRGLVGDLKDNVVATLAGDPLVSQLRNLRTIAVQSSAAANGRRIQQQKEWASFGLDPANRQAAMLQFDLDLSDQERSLIFQNVIIPGIADSYKSGREYNEVNADIEKMLSQPERFVPGYKENPDLRKAVTKMIANRQNVSRMLEAMVDGGSLFGFGAKNTGWPMADVYRRIGDKAAMSPIDAYGQYPYDSPEAKMLRDAPGMQGEVANPIQFGFLGGRERWLQNETSSKPYDWYRRLAPMVPKRQ